MSSLLKKAFAGKRRYISLSILCLLGLLVLYFVTGVVVHAAGITEELQGTSSYEYARLASSYYQLDYHYDAGFLGGLTEGFFYVFHGLTKLVWGFVLVFTYFVISIVREAYSLDIFTTFSDMITQFIQRVVGVDSTGVKNNGLLYGFLFLVILVVAVYMAYQGFAKKSGSKAFGALSNMFIMFIVTVVFIGFSPTILNNVTSFSKEVNTMVLSAGTNTFTSGEVTAEESPEYLSDSLWQVLVKNPWLILEFGSTDVEQSRIDAILANNKDTKARQEVVKNDEVGTRENTVMSADGLWDRLGNTFLILLVDLIVCYFVLMLVATMLIYDFMFLLYVAMSPFVLVFSMFPNNGNSFTRYVMKLFNLLMSKAVILFLMTLAFSLSTMVYQQFSDKSFLFIAFLQIVIYLSVYLNLHQLTALAGIHSRDGTKGISTIDRKVNRRLRKAGRTAGAFIAGNTVGRVSSAITQRKRNHDNEKAREKQEKRENQTNSKTRKQNLPTSDTNLPSDGRAYDVLSDNSTLAKNEKQRLPKADKDTSKKDPNSKSEKTREDSEKRKKQLEMLKQRRNQGANVKRRNPSMQSREISVQDSVNRDISSSSNSSLKQPTNEKTRNTEIKQSSARNATSSNQKNTKTAQPQVSRQSKIHEKVVFSSPTPKQRTVQGVK